MLTYPAAEAPRPDVDGPGVYHFRGADGESLYVGLTRNPRSRIREHMRKEWWPRVASVEWLPCASIGAAAALEKRTIAEHRPTLNKVKVHALPKMPEPVMPDELAEALRYAVGHAGQGGNGTLALSLIVEACVFLGVSDLEIAHATGREVSWVKDHRSRARHRGRMERHYWKTAGLTRPGPGFRSDLRK